MSFTSPRSTPIPSDERPSSSTILVVEDHQDNLQLIVQMLHMASYQVLVAMNGLNALQKLQHTEVDLILLDVMLGEGIDGFEVCRRIKANPPLADIPIIFMTALADLDYKLQGFELGAVDYITKPFQQAEILSRIQLHLKLGQLNRALQIKNESLYAEITARAQAETQLQKLNQDLEARVQERTESLSLALAQLKRQEQKLQYRAHHDVLTGLINRVGLTNALTGCLQGHYAVLFLDLDFFKTINDRFGHVIGDVLLQHVAHRLQDCLAPGDIVGRFGGDEFLMITARSPNALRPFGNHLIAQLQRPFQLGPYAVTIGACIGIVPSTRVYQEVTTILRDADIALCHAKQMGENTCLVLSKQLQQQALERLKLEAELRIALETDQLCLYYQPIFAIAAQTLVGFEVLIRWQHPERGLLAPGRFVPLAEESGLIHSLDCWVLETLTQQWQQWQAQNLCPEGFFFSVNLAAVHFQHQDCYDRLDRLLTQSPIPSNVLKLEITESLFIEAPAMALNPLEQIHRKGFQLCIDDFGTGYSSLSRLHTFPVSTLKIDRAFITAMSATSAPIVETIIKLAHQLGLDVVAEGIETQQQYEQLLALDCDFGQGYWYAKPLNTEEMLQHLAALECTPS